MNPLTKSMLMVFHPLDCCDIIKREHRGGKPEGVWLPALFYAAAFLVNCLSAYSMHFPLAAKKPEETSLLLEAALVVVPLFTWVICSYAMTSIINGESTFREMYTVSGYCLVPYIVLTPLLTIASNLFSLEESGLFGFFKTASLLWVVLLLLLAMKRMNDYDFMKTVGISVLSVIAMVIVWAVCLLTFSLTIQVVYFFTGIEQELSFKFLL